MMINNKKIEIIEKLNQEQLEQIVKAWMNSQMSANGIWGDNTLIYERDNEIWYSYWPFTCSPPAVVEGVYENFLLGLAHYEKPDTIKKGILKLKEMIKEELK